MNQFLLNENLILEKIWKYLSHRNLKVDVRFVVCVSSTAYFINNCLFFSATAVSNHG